MADYALIIETIAVISIALSLLTDLIRQTIRVLPALLNYSL
jgi:hypothetical protein